MLGEKIRNLRKEKKISQEELAEKLSVSRQSVSLWENNQTQPTIENIVVLAKLLEISTDELLLAGNDEEKIEDIDDSCTSISEESVVLEGKNNMADALSKKSSIKKPLVISAIAIVALCVFAVFVVWLLMQGKENTLSAEEIYTRISPSVVEIYAESTTETSTGTGFFFDDKGTVVTNYHVIKNCQTAKIKLTNGTSFKVISVLGYDADRDIAVLSTECEKSKPLSVRTSAAKTGEKVYALGSSLGLTGSLSDGIVSAVNREIEGNTYIQTTAPISNGNSGGPLVDSNGAVIGIICASFADGQNLNLVIPIEALNDISLNSEITLDRLFPEVKPAVEWLSDYRFQYYADEDTYVLLFQLADKNEVPMTANGTVKIRIINDDKVTVYSKTHNFSTENFEEWIYDDAEEMYLAAIYISPDSITKGSTEYGMVYFEVYGADYSFDESSISIFDLPVDVNFTPNNPQHGGGTYSTTTPKPSVTIPSSTAPTKHTCLEAGCSNEVSKMGEYCSDHRCANLGCSYRKDYDSNYCSGCSCSTVGCKNAKIENGYYCADHVCAASSCTAEKSYGKNYCFNHICASCDNIRIDGWFYCEDHTCVVDGCTDIRAPSCEYCTSHQCMAGVCKNRRITGGNYCEEHTCVVEGCNKQKLINNYCYSHTP